MTSNKLIFWLLYFKETNVPNFLLDQCQICKTNPKKLLISFNVELSLMGLANVIFKKATSFIWILVMCHVYDFLVSSKFLIFQIPMHFNLEQHTKKSSNTSFFIQIILTVFQLVIHSCKFLLNGMMICQKIIILLVFFV